MFDDNQYGFLFGNNENILEEENKDNLFMNFLGDDFIKKFDFDLNSKEEESEIFLRKRERENNKLIENDIQKEQPNIQNNINDEEEKKIQKRIKNKGYAKISRERKKKYIQDLEEENKILKSKLKIILEFLNQKLCEKCKENIKNFNHHPKEEENKEDHKEIISNSNEFENKINQEINNLKENSSSNISQRSENSKESKENKTNTNETQNHSPNIRQSPTRIPKLSKCIGLFTIISSIMLLIYEHIHYKNIHYKKIKGKRLLYMHENFDVDEQFVREGRQMINYADAFLYIGDYFKILRGNNFLRNFYKFRIEKPPQQIEEDDIPGIVGKHCDNCMIKLKGNQLGDQSYCKGDKINFRLYLMKNKFWNMNNNSNFIKEITFDNEVLSENNSTFLEIDCEVKGIKEMLVTTGNKKEEKNKPN